MKRYIGISNREIHGALLLDKPTGLSSNMLLNKVKKIFHVSKVGHTGTLDPLATGMLFVCFGKATKFAKYFLNTYKRYHVTARLGISTDTFDVFGRVIRVSSININNNKIEKCLELFRGESLQIPPMFSSLKYCGLPLYKYARKGMTVPRKARVIHIDHLNVIDKNIHTIQLDIQCSKGTYIRSIINDFGECLGCGAHIIELRRLMIGQYSSECMVSLTTLEAIFYDCSLNDIEVFSKLDALLVPMHLIYSYCIAK